MNHTVSHNHAAKSHLYSLSLASKPYWHHAFAKPRYRALPRR
jgi:hypothetical protein